MAGRFKVEHVARKPRGWKVRTVVPPGSAHRVRIACPPGARKKGACRTLEVLHPRSEKNPRCEISQKAKANPSELLIFGNPARVAQNNGGNPGQHWVSRSARRNRAGHQPGCPCFACRHARGEKAAARGKKNSSKLERQRATRHRAARIRGARVNRNPNETTEAVRLFQGFHGRDPDEVIREHVKAVTRLDYTALGDLVYLIVETPLGDRAKFEFDDDGVKLASSPDGKQLYCIGGDQNILHCLSPESREKDFIDVGEAFEVAYLARKIHGGFHPVEYYHEFGELNGSRPRVMYHKLNKQIFFVGGDYFINVDLPKPGTPLGKVSPGIEN